MQQQPDLWAEVTWLPFGLECNLSQQGKNLDEFLAAQYGSSPQGGESTRKQLTDIGSELVFYFNFSANMQRYNTFKAHQLLTWTGERGDQTRLKLALFNAYFTDHRNIT